MSSWNSWAVKCSVLAVCRDAWGPLTCVLGHGHNLGKQLGKVGKIITKETGLEHQGFSGVGGSELTTEKFGFARDPEGGSSLRVLSRFNVSPGTPPRLARIVP